MKLKVAILGLGTMGAGMAKNLLAAHFAVIVYNRTRAKAEALAADGARVAESPAAAASYADVIITMLSDEDACRATWTGPEGALAQARPEQFSSSQAP